MSKSKVKAGEAYVELGIKSMLQKGLNVASAELKKYGRGVATIGAAMSGLSAASLAPLTAAVMKFGEAGAHLSKVSKQTGETAQNLAALSYAAQQNGIDFDDMIGSIEELNIRLGETIRDGTGPAAEAFRNLGLDAQKLAKMSPAERLQEVAEALSKIESESRRGFLADEIFGGDAFKMLPLITQGAEGIAAAMREAQSVGAVLSPADIESAAEYTQTMNRLRSVISGLVNRIGAALAPTITSLANRFAHVVKSIIAVVDANRPLVVAVAGVAAAMGVAGVAVTGLGVAMMGAGAAIVAAKAVIAGAAAVITAVFSPVGLIIGGVAIAAASLGVAFAAVAHHTGLFNVAGREAINVLQALWAVATKTFGGISDAMASGDWKLAAQIGWAGVKVAFWQGLFEIGNALAMMMPKLWETVKEFFKRFVEAAVSTSKMVAQILVAPGATGAVMAAKFIRGLTYGMSESGGIVDWMAAQANGADQELADLVALAKKRREEFEAAVAGQMPDGSGSSSPGSGDPGSTPEAPAIDTSAADARIRELEFQIMALEQGEDAAERARLAEEGLTEAQIDQITALKEKKKALEEAKQATLDAAEAQRQAQEQAKAEMESMKNEAAALLASVMTPAERAQDELNKTLSRASELEASGALSASQAQLVEDRARQAFNEQMERLKAGQNEFDVQAADIVEDEPTATRNGPSGSFSAFAAALIGGGQTFEKEQLRASREIAKNTRDTARRLGAPNTARFG